jgi:uncharacterized protein (TIGR02147 family)
MNAPLPDIISYTNFREYLAEYQSARNKSDKSFSRSNLSRLLGLPNTRSYFTDVLKGKKVTAGFIDRFINVFELNERDAHFFKVLVKYDQAENPEEKQVYFDQMLSLNQASKKVLDKAAIEYYSNWYNSTIRALLDVIDFKDDYSELAKKTFPQILPKQAKESITLLLLLGLIKRNDDGFLKPTDKSISTPDSMHNDELVKKFQAQFIKLALNAVTDTSTKPQAITTNQMSISENSYKMIEERIHKFRADIRSIILMDKEPADRVYQLAVLFFPTSN